MMLTHAHMLRAIFVKSDFNKKKRKDCCQLQTLNFELAQPVWCFSFFYHSRHLYNDIISYRRIRRSCDNWSETFKADFQCVDSNSNPLEIGLSFFWNQLHFSPAPNSLDMELSSLHWSKISSFTFYVSLRVIGRNHHPFHSHFNFFLFFMSYLLWRYNWINFFCIKMTIHKMYLSHPNCVCFRLKNQFHTGEMALITKLAKPKNKIKELGQNNVIGNEATATGDES